MAVDREDVLWRWQTTDDSAEAIAAELNTTRSVVLGLVYRARLAGDTRAKERRPPNRAALARRLDSLQDEISRLRKIVGAR